MRQVYNKDEDRIYDASAKNDGPSLNDCLYTGPALVRKMLDMPIRFRCHRVALIRDIEKSRSQAEMFYVSCGWATSTAPVLK